MIIDGNSGDGTKEWLSNLNNNKIAWISEPDKGIFDAMNKGLNRASGDYVIFMNSSDEFENPNVLDLVSDQIQKSVQKPMFIYGDSIDSTASGERHYKKAKSYKKNHLGLFTSHQAMFFNRSAGIRFRLEYSLTSDYAFVSEYLNMSENVQILELTFPVCDFKLGGTNEISRYKALIEDYRIRREIIGLSRCFSSILYLLHFIHTTMKRLVPRFVQSIRYESE